MVNKTILVAGATGQQGGAVGRHLRQNGWKVRALVRDPEKASAKQLERDGAELAKGDLFDRESLSPALEGVHGVFSVQNFWLPDVGYEGEIKQGKLLAHAAKEAGVEHFVYSSVGSAHRGMGQKHFESKWIIEQYLDEIDLPRTILRPVAFMDNINWSRPEISNGLLRTMGTSSEKRTQMIAADDIGAIATIMFSSPARFLGQTLEIAGDELTDAEKALVLAKVIGRPVKVVKREMPPGFEPDEEQLAAVRFFNGKAYTADIEAVRAIHPGLRTFEQFLLDNGWKDLPVLEMPEGANPWRRG